MLDGVQARLLLQACGLLCICNGFHWLMHSIVETVREARYLRELLAPGMTSVPSSIWNDRVRELAFHSVWVIVAALVCVAGWRLFFAKGELFPALVRGLSR
jgi:hypothetical protein